LVGLKRTPFVAAGYREHELRQITAEWKRRRFNFRVVGDRVSEPT
jgi:hypothetical protein